MNSVGIILLYLFLVGKSKFSLSQIKARDRNATLMRKVRATPYIPYQSGISLGAAVAVPLDNGLFNVFMSYCISGGFGQPEYDSPEGINPSVFQKIYEDPTDESRKRKTKNTFLTRRKFYRIFAENLKQYGFNAEHCTLKAICETAQYQFGDLNGVLGDIIHILFSPTTSKDEKLPSKFYEAEAYGHSNQCNEKYAECPVSVFDLISLIK